MKTLGAVALSVTLGVVAHDLVQIKRETGMSVQDSAKELAKRTKRAFVSEFWRGFNMTSNNK